LTVATSHAAYVTRAWPRCAISVPVRSVCFAKLWIAAMRGLSYWHGIDGRFDAAAVVECRDCVRHMKTRLKQQSLVFRWLNKWANPFFHAFRDRLVSPLERAEAQRFARDSCRRNISGGLRS